MQFTFLGQRVDFGFDISQQFSFNFPEAPVVDVKGLINWLRYFSTKNGLDAGILRFAVRKTVWLCQDAKD